MTATEFFPEYHYLPYRGGYLGTYKLMSEHSFRQIPGRVIYPTSWQAEAAARAYLAKWLNPKIEAERIEQAAELSEFDIWKRQKADEEKAERDRVFGTSPRQIVRDCSGREVVVERKRTVRA